MSGYGMAKRFRAVAHTLPNGRIVWRDVRTRTPGWCGCGRCEVARQPVVRQMAPQFVCAEVGYQTRVSLATKRIHARQFASLN